MSHLVHYEGSYMYVLTMQVFYMFHNTVKGFQPTTWDLDQPFNHADIFDNLDTRAQIAVDLFFFPGMIPILFFRVWHPWGIIPRKKTGVIPWYKWPSLNDSIVTYFKKIEPKGTNQDT